MDRVRNRAEAVPCVQERNTRLLRGVPVYFRVSDINRFFQMIALHHQLNIFSLLQARFPAALEVLKTRSKAVGFQKSGNIALVAVAHNKERRLCGKLCEKSFDPLVQPPAVFTKVFIFHLAAKLK